jgi:uncharacterized protein YaiE (UPF0345 family)
MARLNARFAWLMTMCGPNPTALPDSGHWKKVKGGESFNVPANAKFTVKINAPTDYCCSFVK